MNTKEYENNSCHKENNSKLCYNRSKLLISKHGINRLFMMHAIYINPKLQYRIVYMDRPQPLTPQRDGLNRKLTIFSLQFLNGNCEVLHTKKLMRFIELYFSKYLHQDVSSLFLSTNMFYHNFFLLNSFSNVMVQGLYVLASSMKHWAFNYRD